MLSRLALLPLVALAGCGVLTDSNSVQRVSAEGAELLAVGVGERGQLRAAFRYTGVAPEAGCYALSGYTVSTGTPGSAVRNEALVKDVLVRGSDDPCPTRSARVMIDSLDVALPSPPPGTYRFLFERRGEDPLSVTVRVAADTTVVGT